MRNAAALNDNAAPGGDPLKRLSLQRSNSKLVMHAQEKNLKRSRSAANVPALVNTSGRQFFETGSKGGAAASGGEGDSSEKKSKHGGDEAGADAAPSAEKSKTRRKSTLPQRYVAPTTPAKAKSSLLLRKLDGGTKRKL
jgi:hypothetical protein